METQMLIPINGSPFAFNPLRIYLINFMKETSIMIILGIMSLFYC